MSFGIFVVTYRVTNFLPKLVHMLLFSAEKTEFPFFEFPYFRVLPMKFAKKEDNEPKRRFSLVYVWDLFTKYDPQPPREAKSYFTTYGNTQIIQIAFDLWMFWVDIRVCR